LLVGLLALAICAGLYKAEANRLEAELRNREATRMGVYATFIRHDLRFVSADLHELAEGQALREFLSTGDSQDLGRAADTALLFSRQHPSYDRIVFIDDRGTERFSVSQSGIALPPGSGNQAHESYYLRAAGLAEGQVALSSFTPDSAGGSLLQPPKLLLRFSTPIFDRAGRWRGVYVIHDLASSLFSDISEISPVQFHRLRMLNSQGFWIRASAPSEEWGFMIPGRSGITLAASDPGLWEQIGRKADGQVRRASGLFTWHRIVPRDVVSVGAGDTVAEDPFWVLASEVTGTEWKATFSSLRQSYGITALVLLTLIGVSLQFRRSLQRDRERMTLHFESLFESLPGSVVVLTPNLEIVAASNAYLEVTMSRREAIIGKPLFQAFPKNPSDPVPGNPVAEASRAAIERLLITGRAETMPVQKYDVRRPDGSYVERYWRVTNSPLRGAHGHIEYIIHQVEDVTSSAGQKP
jgi:PAS domain S-box-containing protein